MNLPSTRQLRYFVALAEHRHFGRAAAACHVSQSAFSGAIQELEALLGETLVDRTNRRVTVTALGQQIAVQARLCLRDLEALVEFARSERRRLSGTLRLGVIPTIAPFLLPTVLPGLRRALPQLKLFLHEGLTADLHRRLLDGSLDAIVVALPYDLPGCESATILRDRFRLACRRGTKLIDPALFRFSRLQPDVVLLLEDGHCLRDQAIEACRIRSRGAISRVTATSLLTLVEMVDADLGVTYLPEMALNSPLLQGTDVETYPLPEGASRDIAIAWRQGSAAADEFRSLGAQMLVEWRKRAGRRKAR